MDRRENVGMSNRNSGEIPGHRKPKVSLAMTIIQGLGGPKANPKGVTDGQPVNIPALLCFFSKKTENQKLRVLLDLLFRSCLAVACRVIARRERREFWFRPGQLS